MRMRMPLLSQYIYKKIGQHYSQGYAQHSWAFLSREDQNPKKPQSTKKPEEATIDNTPRREGTSPSIFKPRLLL